MKMWYIYPNIISGNKVVILHIISQPVWLSIVSFLLTRLYIFIPKIPFPNWFPKKRNKRYDCDCSEPNFSCEDHERLYTLKEWYGDSRQLYYNFVCIPVLKWEIYHPRRKEHMFKIGYDEAKSKFYNEYPEVFDTFEKEQLCIQR